MSFKAFQVCLFLSLYICTIPVKFKFIVGLMTVNIKGTQENKPPQATLKNEQNGSNERQEAFFISNNTYYKPTVQHSLHESDIHVFKQDKLFQTTERFFHKRHELVENLSAVSELKLKPHLYQSNVLMDASLKEYPPSGELNMRSLKSDTFNITKPEDHPYAVILFIFDKSKYLGCCSGSLVSLEWVLTAASHCFILDDDVTVTHVEVYAGGNSEREWQNKAYPSGYQLRNSTEYYIHPEYSRKKFYVSYYDVALVKVEKFVKSSTVSEVEIYGRSWEFEGYTSCTFTGFGKHQFYENRDIDFVRKTYKLEVKSPCPCLNNSNTKYHNWICSKPSKDFGICGSDWGAALVCNKQIRALAVVVISYKDLNSCKRNNYEDYVCLQDNSLSIFQNTFPCIKWMNSYLKQYVAKPIYEQNTARQLQLGYVLFWTNIFIIVLRTHFYPTS